VEKNDDSEGGQQRKESKAKSAQREAKGAAQGMQKPRHAGRAAANPHAFSSQAASMPRLLASRRPRRTHLYLGSQGQACAILVDCESGALQGRLCCLRLCLGHVLPQPAASSKAGGMECKHTHSGAGQAVGCTAGSGRQQALPRPGSRHCPAQAAAGSRHHSMQDMPRHATSCQLPAQHTHRG
jgi:hypothetical protein